MPTTVARDRSAVLAELEGKLSKMTPRDRIRLLLRLGVPAIYVMGVPACDHHTGWHNLPDASPLAFDGTVVFCEGCYRWKAC
jgi:hypothetical protein